MPINSLSLSNTYAVCQVLINGRADPKLEADLQRLTVIEDLEAPSMVELQLDNYDILTQEITWSDDPQISPGAGIEIKLGYENDLELVIDGEITGLEPQFSSEDKPYLIVRGHDRRHRLLRGTHTQSFVKLKDSEIAQQIATQNGLSAAVTDTQVQLEYVLQNNQSDLAFLQARSQRIGYEVWIDQKTLHFQPPQHRTLFTLKLTADGDLIEFLPRLSVLNQVSDIKVRSWNWQDKKEMVSTAAPTVPLMGGEQTGVRASQLAFGKTSQHIVNQPVQNKAEADQIGKGQFEENSLQYITGEGVCIGNPKLRAGSVVEISGVGKRFSGHYYVTAVTHQYSIDEEGYRTEFTVRRTAA